MLDTFPLGLFRPYSMRWYRDFVTNSGGRGANGIQRRSKTDGGGLWRCEMSVRLTSVTSVKAARAFIEGMNGGSTPVIVPFYNRREAPFPGGVEAGAASHGDGSTFSDMSEYASGSIEAYLSAPLALRSVAMGVDAVAMAPLAGGEMFTVTHPDKGPRLYVLTRIPEDGGQLKFQPPSRGTALAGDVVDFENPRCPMYLVNPTEVMDALTPPYFSALSLQFEESLDDVA